MNEIAKLRQVLPAAGEDTTEALPHNIEAEQQLLGQILTNNDVFDRVYSKVKPEHFFDPVLARIFEIARLLCHRFLNRMHCLVFVQVGLHLTLT